MNASSILRSYGAAPVDVHVARGHRSGKSRSSRNSPGCFTSFSAPPSKGVLECSLAILRATPSLYKARCALQYNPEYPCRCEPPRASRCTTSNTLTPLAGIADIDAADSWRTRTHAGCLRGRARNDEDGLCLAILALRCRHLHLLSRK